MHNNKLTITAIFILSTVILFSGCANNVGNNEVQNQRTSIKEKNALMLKFYKKILKSNNSQDYEVFLKKYPNYEYIEIVKSRLNYFKFHELRKRNSLEDYQEYLKKYPTSRYANKIKKRIEHLKLVKHFKSISEG